MNEHNLEFYVPDGAKVTEGQAMTAGGQPVKSAPVPEGENAKNRYAFLFPLRPGETRFNVVYTVPYTGSVNIDPKSIYPLEHFVAIAPKADGILRRSRRQLSNRAVSPASLMPTSKLPPMHRWASPWPSSSPGKARLAAPAEDGQTSAGARTLRPK